MKKLFGKVETVEGTVENAPAVVKVPLKERIKVKLEPAKKVVKPILITSGIAAAAIGIGILFGAPAPETDEGDYDGDYSETDTEPADSED